MEWRRFVTYLWNDRRIIIKIYRASPTLSEIFFERVHLGT